VFLALCGVGQSVTYDEGENKNCDSITPVDQIDVEFTLKTDSNGGCNCGAQILRESLKHLIDTIRLGFNVVDHQRCVDGSRTTQ